MKANSICYTCIKSQWSSGLLLIKLAGRTTITKVTGIMQFNECQARYRYHVTLEAEASERYCKMFGQDINLFCCFIAIKRFQTINSSTVKTSVKTSNVITNFIIMLIIVYMKTTFH